MNAVINMNSQLSIQKINEYRLPPQWILTMRSDYSDQLSCRAAEWSKWPLNSPQKALRSQKSKILNDQEIISTKMNAWHSEWPDVTCKTQQDVEFSAEHIQNACISHIKQCRFTEAVWTLKTRPLEEEAIIRKCQDLGLGL